MIPSLSTSTPALASPATTAASRNSPEARGSRPTTATGRGPGPAGPRLGAAEHGGRGHAEVQGQTGGQLVTSDTADTVRTEQTATLPRFSHFAPLAALLVRPGSCAWLDRLRAGGTYRLEYCGALRAFFRPYFLRSLTRASLVRKPAFFSAGRFSGSTRVSALVTPRRSAPACPVTPPPVILATTSNWFSAPRVTNGSLTSCWCTLFWK